MKTIAFSSQKVIDGCRVQQQQTTRFDIRKMLLPLIVLSVLIELPTNSAFNQSELVRIPRHNYYGAEPSLYYTNFNPFRPYWLNRPHYLGKSVVLNFRDLLRSLQLTQILFFNGMVKCQITLVEVVCLIPYKEGPDYRADSD